MPFRGDVRVNELTHPVGTPPNEIYDFEIWDGEKWLPACTARDMIYKIGTGGTGLSELFEDGK